ncbi:hypothetical protein [Staphylococcus pseudintermedius]|uniref:hypothetical protein n=1 Tax=Staphylococcus pseudintermedius TaxID=283734 RepID=UPI001F558B78|nr:hypothetical protein [Staphylococcus pseudintermedius]
MEKEKMLSIANKLNLYLALSEVHAFVQFCRSSAGSFLSISLTSTKNTLTTIKRFLFMTGKVMKESKV